VNVVILCVHYHQLRLKVFAHTGEVQAQFLNGISIKHTPLSVNRMKYIDQCH
jgi:hypothetical protein